jgi:toxin CptA
MSIAVSAIVVPSRRLRALSAGFALANMAAAALVGTVLRERYLGAQLLAIFFLVAALCLSHAAARKIKTLRIDVSGLGQVRLTVQQDLGTNEAGDETTATQVALLAGSTIWPQLMLLLLRSERGALTVLPILRDSLAPQQFRALSVALRAAGGRNTRAPHCAPDRPFVGTHKIL